MIGPTSVSITIPVYNEEQLLADVVHELLAALQRTGVAFEVILAENGSTDSTSRIVDELAQRDHRVRAIHLPLPDYGQAVRQGFLAGSADCLANFSVDWVDIGFLQAGLAKLDQFDIVIGSKSIARSSDQRPLIRRLGGFLFHDLAQVLFDLPVSDAHGIKVLRRDKVVALVEKCRFGGQVFDTELVARAHQAGLAMCEVPVHVEEKRPSRVGVLTRAWQGLAQLVKLRIVLWQEGIR